MATKNAPRIMITIDGKETLLTNAIMMNYAIDALNSVGAPAEVITKAEQHLEQLTKKSNAPKVESRAGKENAKLAAEVLAVMPDGEPVLTSWIMEHVRFITTPQKCTQVMKVLINAGYVEKVAKVNGRYVGYKVVSRG